MLFYGQNIDIPLYCRTRGNYEILSEISLLMYVQRAIIESFISEQIGGGGMEDSNLKLCDNLVRGYLCIHFL